MMVCFKVVRRAAGFVRRRTTPRVVGHAAGVGVVARAAPASVELVCYDKGVAGFHQQVPRPDGSGGYAAGDFPGLGFLPFGGSVLNRPGLLTLAAGANPGGDTSTGTTSGTLPGVTTTTIAPTTVPEPATWALLAVAVLILCIVRRDRTRTAELRATLARMAQDDGGRYGGAR